MWSGLEGRLASGRGPPYSDIDIRFAIADEDYDHLWKVERTPLLVGLGDYLLLVYSVAGQIYRSTDCGHTWTKLSREFGEVRAVALAA